LSAKRLKTDKKKTYLGSGRLVSLSAATSLSLAREVFLLKKINVSLAKYNKTTKKKKKTTKKKEKKKEKAKKRKKSIKKRPTCLS
jgi:hypothetical protein